MTFPFSTHNYQLRSLDGGRRRRIRTRTCGWWCCRHPTWWTASPAGKSTAFASARRGIRSRSNSASGISFISDATSLLARRKKFWPCGRHGRQIVPTCCAACCAPSAGRRTSSMIRPTSMRLPAPCCAESARNRSRIGALNDRGQIAPRRRRSLAQRRALHPDRPRWCCAPGSGTRCLALRADGAVEAGTAVDWLLDAAKACFRPDLYDAVFGESVETPNLPADHIGAFTGPPFEADNISRHASVGRAIAVAGLTAANAQYFRAGCEAGGHPRPLPDVEPQSTC